MSETFSRLICPLALSTFLNHYSTRTHFHVERNLVGYYDDLLSASDIDVFFQSEHLPAAFFNVVQGGTRYPIEEWSRFDSLDRGPTRVAVPQKLFGLYSNGATLILNGANRAIPSLNTLCGTLTRDLGFPAHTNIYISPRGTVGFSEHADNHEVLVLQIAGTKRWVLNMRDIAPAEIALQPGDLLYVPRGLAHAARTQDCDSIHITLGLKPIYAFQLIEELATLAGKDDNFQQPVPPLFGDAEARQAFETTFLRQLQSLLLRTKTSELLEQRFHTFVEKQAGIWPGRFSDLRLFHDMTLKTVVRRRPEVLTAVKEDGKFLRVEFVGEGFQIPAFLEGALQRILGDNPFAIGEIDGFITSEGKVKLVGEFVKSGLLRIVNI